jgi:epoxyqueuosine reductase
MTSTLKNFASKEELQSLAGDIKSWGKSLGFSAVGITDTNLSGSEAQYQKWIEKGFHGAMDYMAKHGHKRSQPSELVPGTIRIISVRMDYIPPEVRDSESVLNDGESAFISRYALGRDYHKVLRNRLQKLCDRIQEEVGDFSYRVFTDSAPVLEGSNFFVGEIYTDLPLPVDEPIGNHCGTCQACIDICPTQAIIGPYELDARRCISYLTIELKTSIPIEFRPLIGNRVYGCDDCQLSCPWNKFAQLTEQEDFHVRHGLDDVLLVDLFSWNESTFNEKMAGSAIYRIGHEQWLRNIAVGLGNAPSTPQVINALLSRRHDDSQMLREHVAWALQQHGITV